MRILVGAIMLLMASTGIMDGESWAESGWGEDNVAEHDAEYERMWALHLMPLAAMAIATGLLVKGKALAQMAMAASASVSFCSIRITDWFSADTSSSCTRFTSVLDILQEIVGG